MDLQDPAAPVGSSEEVPKALCVSWLLLSPVALGSKTAAMVVLGSPMLDSLAGVTLSAVAIVVSVCQGPKVVLLSRYFMASWTHSASGSAQKNLFLMVSKLQQRKTGTQ